MLCIGFLMLAYLIWLAKSDPQVSLPLAGLERIEQRLQRLDNLTQSNGSGEWKSLQLRLDQLEAKIAEMFASASPPLAEIKAQSQQISRLEVKLEGLTQRAFAPPAPPGPLQIRVISKDWGDAEPDNLQAVCISAANEIWRFFPDRRIEPITVNSTTKDPMVIFGRGPDGERRILLNIKGKLWARCAYQFSHEFCHILCNYRKVKNPNLWFEEALCETASLFALRRMAENWKSKPPYSNWKGYSTALEDYANTMSREVPSLDKLTLAEWFANNESLLRSDGTNRPRNRLFALAFLKLLEKNPHHWQAVGYLNQWEAMDPNLSFQAYLSDWFQRVPAIHKPFVQEIAGLFAIPLK